MRLSPAGGWGGRNPIEDRGRTDRARSRPEQWPSCGTRTGNWAWRCRMCQRQRPSSLGGPDRTLDPGGRTRTGARWHTVPRAEGSTSGCRTRLSSTPAAGQSSSPQLRSATYVIPLSHLPMCGRGATVVSRTIFPSLKTVTYPQVSKALLRATTAAIRSAANASSESEVGDCFEAVSCLCVILPSSKSIGELPELSYTAHSSTRWRKMVSESRQPE